jgi:hypothetical protein
VEIIMKNRSCFRHCLPVFFAAGFCLAGCDSPVVSPDINQQDTSNDTTTDNGRPDPTVVDENFRVIYGYAGAISGTPGELLIGNPAISPEPGNPGWTDNFKIVESSLTDLGLDCTNGCVSDRDLRHIAVTLGASANGYGYDVAIVEFDDMMTASMALENPLTSVRQAVFCGETLYISRYKPGCEPQSGPAKTCYQFEKLVLPTTETEVLFTFPTAADLADSNYSGRFRTGEDCDSMILQNPDSSSVTLWMFKDSQLRKVGKQFCQAYTADGETCMYKSGAPELSDDQPVGLSTDGKLFFVHVENSAELRIFKIDTGADDVMTWSTVVKTPATDTGGNYLQNACLNLKPWWRWNAILSPLRILSDNSEVVFTASSDCDPDINKPWTDIVAVPVENIGNPDAAGPTFFRKITDFPQIATAACISVPKDGFDVSSSGKYVIFIGTAALDSSGRPIRDDSPQHYLDREVFVTSFDGSSSPVQISGNLDYNASTVLASVDDPWFAAITDPPAEDAQP